MAAIKKIRLGDLLVQNGIISEDQLMTALAEQKRCGRKLGKMLVELKYVEERQLLEFLSRQLQIPYIDLGQQSYEADTIRQLPETLARRFRCLLLKQDDHSALVGMTDPTDLLAVDEIGAVLNKPIRQAVVRESDLLQVLDQVYRKTSEISSLAGQLQEQMSENDFDVSSLGDPRDVSEAPVVKLLQSMLEEAAQLGASDIHIEPDETCLRIRQRVDGVLQEQIVEESRIASAMVVRLKLMSGLDISEKRVPQDGRFNIRVRDKSIDVRVSTLPVQYGESVVMRLLDQSGGLLNLDQLGLPEQLKQRFRKYIQNPHGLVLVTGPTGSGKTTTLYAALNELNSAERKIITAEDPVEYRLSRINQVQVNPKVDLTFAKVLRSALRQDPDVVMVGEMRDSETAQIGLRAAMTGHLVLSTLHTNDAIATASRLIDMGCEGFLVASGLRAIIAQRLVRRICNNCKQSAAPDEREQAWLQHECADQPELRELHRGAGCNRCNHTGYRGRLGVYELLEIDSGMAQALRNNDSAQFTAAAHANPNYRELRLCALDYARQGMTTLDEVIRVAGEGW